MLVCSLQLVLQLFRFMRRCTLLQYIRVDPNDDDLLLVGECLPPTGIRKLAIPALSGLFGVQYWTDFLEHVAWPFMWIETVRTVKLAAIAIE
jgi:hypothetical protein